MEGVKAGGEKGKGYLRSLGRWTKERKCGGTVFMPTKTGPKGLLEDADTKITLAGTDTELLPSSGEAV